MNYVCPICGKYELEEGISDVCPVCSFEDDNLQVADHNYAGGANNLSVNEGRIEFFLLNNPNTKDKAQKLFDDYHYKYKEIRLKYKDINHAIDIKLSEKERLAFKEIRKDYVNALNLILQKLNEK